MRKLTAQLKRNAGFTLIELLVVIGILGILAAALIAAVDPLEQLKKASDTAAKTTMNEYNEAVARYYTIHSGLPWNATAAGGDAGCTTLAGALPMSAKTLSTLSSCMTAIINDNELKASFTANTNILSKIIVSGTTSTVTSCYLPQSKQAQADPLAKFNSTGGASGLAGSTYYCVN